MTVSAVNVYPSGQSVYISTRGQLGFTRHGSCENEIQLIAQAATPTRSWTLIGCSPPGDGTVYLKTRYQGRTITLDTISIDVWAAPTMPTGTPVAVSNLSAAASTTSARLTWARLDGAEKYRVAHRAGGTTGNWLNPVETTARAHTVPNLAPGTSYQFRVRAYGDGETYLAEWGAEATITASTLDTTPSKPPPPAGFTASASADTAGRVTLTWDTRAGVARYEVRYRRGSGSWTVRPNITGTGSKITHHVDGLTCGASHDFRVKAYGDGATYLAEWGDEAEDDAAPLCNPDPPGGLNASAPGKNSVSVSWTALTGADKYAVRYQQGSSGDWAEYRDDITGTSPTVSGLRCDTGYRFSVRAYGDGVTLARDWGAWSSASDEIRTSTCTTNPTGSIRASPAKIAVGHSTTITASWSGAGVEPEIVVGDTSVLGENASCPGVSGASGASGASGEAPLPTETSKTLYGCASGLSVVQLRDEAKNKTLATVTVTVLPLPIVNSHSRIGYRWFNIAWQAAPDYASFTIEWRDRRDPHATPVTPPKAWSELAVSGQSGPRALIRGKSADVRGIDYVPDTDVEIQVVGIISGQRAVSSVYRVSRGVQPPARGHHPDHTMVYIDMISASGQHAELAGWIKPQLWSAASAWADIMSTLVACEDVCSDKTRNSDEDIFSVEISADCGIGAAACVKGLPARHLGLELEGRIVGSGLRILFVPQTAPFRAHLWSDEPTLDRQVLRSGHRVFWIDRVIIHEFGHAFGLADRYPGGSHEDPNYRGIMGDQPGDKGIKPDDRAAITAIYATHTRNHGW